METVCARGAPPADLTSPTLRFCGLIQALVTNPDSKEAPAEEAEGVGEVLEVRQGSWEFRDGKGLRALLNPHLTGFRSLITSTRRQVRGWCWARGRTGSCTQAATGTRGYASPSRKSRNPTAGAVLRARGRDRGPKWAGQVSCTKSCEVRVGGAVDREPLMP